MTVKTAELDTLRNYTFVVVICRYQDKWLYCRLNNSDSFSNAGGHIEAGETPLEAAKRELYEETGAIAYDITPVFDYSVEKPEGYTTGQVYHKETNDENCGNTLANSSVESSAEYTTGQVYFAQIYEIGELPEFEMVETRLFEALPEKMRFPEIMPVIYKRMQIWLNLHSAEGEIWDVYDSKR